MHKDIQEKLLNISFETFKEKVEGCRYSECLISLLERLGVNKILYTDYYDDYQGHLEAIALLNDGNVFRYYYSYGSCSGCDEWEGRVMDGELRKENEWTYENMHQKIQEEMERDGDILTMDEFRKLYPDLII